MLHTQYAHELDAVGLPTDSVPKIALRLSYPPHSPHSRTCSYRGKESISSEPDPFISAIIFNW